MIFCERCNMEGDTLVCVFQFQALRVVDHLINAVERNCQLLAQAPITIGTQDIAPVPFFPCTRFRLARPSLTHFFPAHLATSAFLLPRPRATFGELRGSYHQIVLRCTLSIDRSRPAVSLLGSGLAGSDEGCLVPVEAERERRSWAAVLPARTGACPASVAGCAWRRCRPAVRRRTQRCCYSPTHCLSPPRGSRPSGHS